MCKAHLPASHLLLAKLDYSNFKNCSSLWAEANVGEMKLLGSFCPVLQKIEDNCMVYSREMSYSKIECNEGHFSDCDLESKSNFSDKE